ncbi:MAG: hypothetical protein AAFZ49_01450, partial [Cyanobacteria bacterium J06659_2]
SSHSSSLLTLDKGSTCVTDNNEPVISSFETHSIQPFFNKIGTVENSSSGGQAAATTCFEDLHARVAPNVTPSKAKIGQSLQDPAPPPSAENTTPSSVTPPEAPDAASPDVPLARSSNDTASESLPPLPEDPDPFVQAVRLAEQAAADGKIAETAADWLDLASRWQRASDLMSQVPETDERYPTAQDRVDAYQQNSEAALAEAEE